MTKLKFENNSEKPEPILVIGDESYRLIKTEDESKLDNLISQMENIIANNKGDGLTEEQRDDIFVKNTLLHKEYTITLRDNKFKFYLNRKQYQFLTSLLLTKLEYGIDTIFTAIELTNMLASMKDTKFKNDDDLVGFDITATDMTYVYHLISTHKVKGLTNDTYVFSQILLRIGNLAKVINYYDNYSKSLKSDIEIWGGNMSGVEKITETVTETETVTDSTTVTA